MAVLIIGGCFAVGYLIFDTKNSTDEKEPTQTEVVTSKEQAIYTERYSARVDRVDVVFEHTNYTKYRITTNGLVREGELNTERGYNDDDDATVYVLNWQLEEGEQIRYVRLTAEPEKLYVLDASNEIISGSPLMLEQSE